MQKQQTKRGIMMVDLKELKKEYAFRNWIKRLNLFVIGNTDWLTNQAMPALPTNRKESSVFEEKELDNWWYDNYKDFSRYSTWHYLYAGLNCFDNYSKHSAFYAHQYLGDKQIKSIVDVGAGIGLSTMLLAELFPKAKVYYNNISPSLQHSFFESHKFYRTNCSGLSENDPAFITEEQMVQHGPFDMLFASEYFEHFEQPMLQTKFLFDNVGFKYLVVNNSFNVKAYGHFNEYECSGKLTPKQMSKLWLGYARCDYKEMEVKCWNGRPKIFEKK
jgi:2-polyprenyl-3-methyl-5-hydroxy-6-metoxy-1,4-benzoquinol methylase